MVKGVTAGQPHGSGPGRQVVRGSPGDRAQGEEPTGQGGPRGRVRRIERTEGQAHDGPGHVPPRAEPDAVVVGHQVDVVEHGDRQDAPAQRQAVIGRRKVRPPQAAGLHLSTVRRRPGAARAPRR